MRNLQLRLRLDAAVGQIAARLRAARAASVASKNFAASSTTSCSVLRRSSRASASGVDLRQRQAGHRGEPLHRLGEGHPLGLHHEVEDVAVLAGGEIEPRRLLVIDEERGRLLLVERRKPLPLAPGLLQLHAPADDLRNRKARAQVVEERGGKRMVIWALLEPILSHIAARSWRRPQGRACPGYSQALGDCLKPRDACLTSMSVKIAASGEKSQARSAFSRASDCCSCRTPAFAQTRRPVGSWTLVLERRVQQGSPKTCSSFGADPQGPR